MANPNLTDMTEEDAADLQFPKESASRVSSTAATVENNDDASDNELDVSRVTERVDSTSDPVCRVCKTTLSEPYVSCAECRGTDVCLVCFANGSEKDEHRNDHNYVVVKNEFPLIEGSGWSARQESELLDVIRECGYGNWVDVARRMQGKSMEECKRHYSECYIDGQGLPGLPKIKETRASLFARETVPYLFKLQDLEEPPRFAVNTVNSRFLAGYNAARSDFEVNFDNHAELLVSDLKYDEFAPGEPDYDLSSDLQIAIVDAYNNRLRERMRRRRIIRDHGLIAFRRTMSWLRRYETTITRPVAERLLIFMQLLGGVEFDFIVEGLHRVGEIKNYITKLVDYRRNGLKTFRSVAMFKRLSKLRRENDKERKQYLNNAEYSWRSVLPCYGSPSSPAAASAAAAAAAAAATATCCLATSCGNVSLSAAQSMQSLRKVPPPLEIRGLPGSEKLTSDERELCSTARVLPSNYFDYKRILTNENKKIGSLRLAQARILLKIDVNKTRKIYDFLAEQGYITKPAQ